MWDKRLSDIFWINSVAISNDGSRVVAATYLHDYRQKAGKGLPNVRSRFGTYCFDGAPPKDDAPKDPLWSDEYEAWDGVFGVAISGDGMIAAASGFLDRTGDVAQGLVRAYDATDGRKLLNFTGVDKRVSWVSLSYDGKVLAAVADDVYVFLRNGADFNPAPLRLGIRDVADEFVSNVAVHPDGTWLAACDKVGHVYVARIDATRGVLSSPITWKAPQGEEFPFLSVAIAAQANTFVVGGGNDAFLFDLADVLANQHDPSLIQPLRFNTTADEDPATIPLHKDPAKIQENVRWAAISANGNLVSVVANRKDPVTKKPTGVIMMLTRQGSDLTREWREFIDKNPNSTSIDAAGQFVTLADGFPTIRPARFHLFEASGTKRWDFGTFSMNWPMVISANGKAIVAGGDDGAVYYFTP
jgi:WD40 repeat protein